MIAPRWSAQVALAAVAMCLISCGGSDDAGAGKTKGILTPGDTMGMVPPSGAIALGGDAWLNERKQESPGLGWSWDGEVLEVVPGSGNLRTLEEFGDCRIHVEFNVASDPGEDWRSDGNSGVYIQRRYELQILNSRPGKPSDESCGAIYTQRRPDRNAGRPAGEWQVFDIVFRAARWSGEEKVENARLTATHNGVMIHSDAALPDKTGRGRPEGPGEGPLRLQDHGSVVQFRNVWIERLDLD